MRRRLDKKPALSEADFAKLVEENEDDVSQGGGSSSSRLLKWGKNVVILKLVQTTTQETHGNQLFSMVHLHLFLTYLEHLPNCLSNPICSAAAAASVRYPAYQGLTPTTLAPAPMITKMMMLEMMAPLAAGHGRHLGGGSSSSRHPLRCRELRQFLRQQVTAQ